MNPSLFLKPELDRLLDLQHRSYMLLKWVADAVPKGFITFQNAHDYSTLPESAVVWIHEHFLNIPPEARPAKADIEVFSNFFTTYLVNSFDLVDQPGKKLYSPGAHCFCPLCSWLVDAPSLKTKKVRSGQKNRAEKLRQNALIRLASQLNEDLTLHAIEKLLATAGTLEDASLVAYGLDLSQREQGIAESPAILALWRSFAWNREGSPKKNFELGSSLILNAEERLSQLLQSSID